MAEEILDVPLPTKARLVQTTTTGAPMKKTTSQARIVPPEARVPSSESIADLNPKESEDIKEEPIEEVKIMKKRRKRSTDGSESDDSDQDPIEDKPFGSTSRWFLIFLCCIFGSMAFVWWIGGPDEVTVDLLDAQYAALGLDPSATDALVKSTFKKLAMKFHPDKCREDHCAKEYVKIETAKKTILQWGDYFRARRVVVAHSAI